MSAMNGMQIAIKDDNGKKEVIIHLPLKGKYIAATWDNGDKTLTDAKVLETNTEEM